MGIDFKKSGPVRCKKTRGKLQPFKAKATLCVIFKKEQVSHFPIH